jgi:hypothetical protein
MGKIHTELLWGNLLERGHVAVNKETDYNIEMNLRETDK